MGVGVVWIPSTRVHGAPVFTSDLLPFLSRVDRLAASLRHVAGFPDPGLLRRLRHAPRPSVDDVPARMKRATWALPTFTSDRWLTGPDPPRWSRRTSYGASRAGSSRTPSRLACRTRAVWRCRPVPSLSGLLLPSPAPPGSGCPQLHRAAATGQRRAPTSAAPLAWPAAAPGSSRLRATV
jgi:hypothetical protein